MKRAPGNLRWPIEGKAFYLKLNTHSKESLSGNRDNQATISDIPTDVVIRIVEKVEVDDMPEMTKRKWIFWLSSKL